MKQILLAVIACFLLSSCSKNKVENALDGWWTMDTIYYKNTNIRTCLSSNSLFMKFGEKSEFPTAKGGCGPVIKNSDDAFADLQVLKSDQKNDTIPFRLKIATKNEVFAGTHKIIFYNDKENRLLKMEIFSDSLYIVCRKGLFNYESNIGLIKELEDITWTTHPR